MHKALIRCLLVFAIGLVLFSRFSLAENTFNEAFERGRALAASQQSGVINDLANRAPQSLPGFVTARPEEANLSGNALQARALEKQTPASEAVKRSFQTRPVYHVGSQEAGIQRAKQIVDNATAVLEGQENDNTQCRSLSQCQIQYETRQCREPRGQAPVCTERLQINVSQPSMIEETIRVYVTVLSRRRATLNIDVREGDVLSTSNVRDRRVVVEPRLPEGLDCQALDNLIFVGATFYDDPKQDNTMRTHRVSLANGQTPSCANGFQARVVLTQGGDHKRHWHWHGGVFTYRLRYRPPGEVVDESWQGNCGYWVSRTENQQCTEPEPPTCLEGPETRLIGNRSFTRACWARERRFQCQSPIVQDTCEPLRDQGCEQVGSRCKEGAMIDGVCQAYEQTYRCPLNECNEPVRVQCNSQVFCLEGNCQDTDVVPGTQEAFQQALTGLSAVGAASKDLSELNDIIFNGRAKNCRDAPLNASNCCREDGWAENLGYKRCKPSEKQLAQDKKNGLCVYLGKRCSHRIAGICTDHKKVYCCYHSKLGRLVQEEGKAQLHLGFGTAKTPQCQGFTVDQLQQLDVGAMDLSEFYDDLEARMRMPQVGKTQTRIRDRIGDFYQTGGV